MLRIAVDVFKAISGENDERYLSAREQLAYVYKSLGLPQKSEELYR